MTDTNSNIGEQKVRKQTRKYIGMFVGALIFGGLIGYLMGFSEGGSGNFLTGDVENLTMTPGMAIALAAAIFIGLIGYPLYTLRHVDELERAINVKATAIAGLVALGLYPVWQVLAIGGLVPHPSAHTMFLATMAAGFITYTWLKFRP